MAIVMNNHVFKGHKTLLGTKFVTYGEVELPTRYELFSSSEGFDWGNTSKAASQLAFSMLCQVSDEAVAKEYAQKYADAVIRSLSNRDWVISALDVLSWIDNNCDIVKEKDESFVNTKLSPPTAKIVPKKIKKNKSNVVKDVCKELGITQKQLAEILEVPEGTVSSWAVKNDIPRLGKKAIEFYIQNTKNQKIVDSYKNFIELLQIS
ncbi:DUF6166 domain-containing protein [Sulfurimonas sp.]